MDGTQGPTTRTRPGTDSALPFLGSCALALLAASAATWARFVAEGSLRLVPGTRANLLAQGMVGLVLLWVGLAALRRFERTDQHGVTALVRASVVLQLCALPALALTSSDMFSNLAYAALSALGKNPCLLGPSALGKGPVLALVSPRWADTPSAYGPILNLLGWLAGKVGHLVGSPVWGAGAAYKLLAAAATAGAIVCAAKTARALGTRVAAQGLAVVALSPLLAWELTAQGHNDAVMVCALCAFAWAAARGQDGLGALALGVGVLAKAGIAPLLLLWLVVMWRRSPRRTLGWAAALAVLAMLAWAPFWAGWETLRGVGATAGGDLERHTNSLQDMLNLLLTPVWPAVKAPLFRSFQIASFAVLGVGTLWAALKVKQCRGAGTSRDCDPARLLLDDALVRAMVCDLAAAAVHARTRPALATAGRKIRRDLRGAVCAATRSLHHRPRQPLDRASRVEALARRRRRQRHQRIGAGARNRSLTRRLAASDRGRGPSASARIDTPLRIPGLDRHTALRY